MMNQQALKWFYAAGERVGLHGGAVVWTVASQS